MAINQLEDYRQSIDLLDSAIVTLLAERMRLVQKVGQYKKEKNITPLQPERWEAVLNSKKNLAKNVGISPTLISDIYTRIHEHALEIENG